MNTLKIVSLIAGFTASQVSFACSCKALSVKEKLELSDSAFIGRIIETRRIEEDPTAILLEGKTETTLIVLQTLRGEVKEGDKVIVRTGDPCPYAFHDGYDHLVYAKGTKLELVTSLCSGNLAYPKGTMNQTIKEEIILIELFL